MIVVSILNPNIKNLILLVCNCRCQSPWFSLIASIIHFFLLNTGVTSNTHLPYGTLSNCMVIAITKEFISIARVVHLPILCELGLHERKVSVHSEQTIGSCLMLCTQSFAAQIVGQLGQTSQKVVAIQERRHVLDIVNLGKVDSQQFKEGLFIMRQFLSCQYLEKVGKVISRMEWHPFHSVIQNQPRHHQQFSKQQRIDSVCGMVRKANARVDQQSRSYYSEKPNE